jgi:ABC-type dipeptide/oligopeptide/nickel transport system ATPase component
MNTNILEIKNLRVSFAGKPALDELSLNIPQGSTYALVGESGSGKSVTCAAILGLLPGSASVSGEIIYGGQNLLNNPLQASLRGSKFAYIPQNPLTSLNPVRTVGSQLSETICTHKPNLKNNEVKALTEKLLNDVQLKDHGKVLNLYPFELSGGMAQRVMIAMALVANPVLLLADEPTTALDVTIQAEIMCLLLKMRQEHGLTLFLITHDLALVAQSCEQVAVLRHGKLCESGRLQDVFSNPQHQYTASLLRACA